MAVRRMALRRTFPRAAMGKFTISEVVSLTDRFPPHFRSRQTQGLKIPASPYSIQNNNLGNVPNGVVMNGNAIPTPATKHSMLDKLKLFNKEKSDRSSKTQISKRTSSSSGFSSARSERSDSSLSLNDGHGTTKVSNLKKPEIPTNVKPPKTTGKLLSSSKNGSKDTLNSKKKDKSPARGSETHQVAESKLQGLKIAKSTSKSESKLKPVSGAKGVELRSESRNSISQIPSPKGMNQAAVPVNTGIPKPVAAIKGTTKPQMYQLVNGVDVKSDKMADISNQNISVPECKMHIIAPILIEAGGSPAHHLQHQQVLQQNISMTDSAHSKSTHSSSTGLHSNSSESSVIYRPSSESGSDILHVRNVTMTPPPSNKVIIPNRKIDRFAEPVIVHHNGGAMDGSGRKFNTVPSKMLHAVNGIIYEEEKPLTVLPMRPLLRGYNSHVTLPTRGARGQHLVSEYCEDIGQGYCSDGDALRKMSTRFSDIDNGYMSEGGGTIHHPKQLLMRARSQLPTTIEER